MKVHYEFGLIGFQSDLFFPKHLLKTKIDVLVVLMEACRLILTTPPSSKVHATEKLILKIEKMSRVTFVSEKKYYSIFFPFFLIEEANKLKIWYKNKCEIDAFIISKILEIIKNTNFESDNALDFFEPIDSSENEIDSFWDILKYLLLFEDGYLRFDIDQTAYDTAVAKGNKDLHPLYHCDIFYSNGNTFKIGLNKSIDVNEFIDNLDNTKKRNYLNI